MKSQVNSIIRLNAGNDTNGNPRRVYVAMNKSGTVLAAIDEGYAGTYAVPESLRAMAGNCPTFATTPKEYWQILKEFPNQI